MFEGRLGKADKELQDFSFSEIKDRRHEYFFVAQNLFCSSFGSHHKLTVEPIISYYIILGGFTL
jgi:hypothetical protein